MSATYLLMEQRMLNAIARAEAAETKVRGLEETGTYLLARAESAEARVAELELAGAEVYFGRLPDAKAIVEAAAVAAVVRWLRGPHGYCDIEYAAEAIERGDHIPPPASVKTRDWEDIRAERFTAEELAESDRWVAAVAHPMAEDGFGPTAGTPDKEGSDDGAPMSNEQKLLELHCATYRLGKIDGLERAAEIADALGGNGWTAAQDIRAAARALGGGE